MREPGPEHTGVYFQIGEPLLRLNGNSFRSRVRYPSRRTGRFLYSIFYFNSSVIVLSLSLSSLPFVLVGGVRGSRSKVLIDGRTCRVFTRVPRTFPSFLSLVAMTDVSPGISRDPSYCGMELLLLSDFV